MSKDGYLLILVALYFLYDYAIKIRSAYRYRKDIMASEHDNKFVFSRNDGFTFIPVIPLVIIIIFVPSLPSVLLMLPFTLILLVLYISFNQQRVNLEEDIVLFKDREVRVSNTEVTRVSISENEVIIDTTKYLNHYSFKSKRLMDKNWIDFQKAIGQYTSQFNHIKVEKV